MKMLFFLLGISFAFSAWSQNQGLVLFEQKVNLHRRITIENEDMKKMMPEFQMTRHELLFKENESLYRPLDEEEEMPGAGGGGMVMRFRRPDVIIYRNHENEYQLAQRSIFEKKYLVEDTLKTAAWKLGTETKSILGHNCNKATLTVEVKRDTVITKNQISAWFTPDIYSPFGPETYGGLPGMILELDINNGEVVYAAKSIEPNAELKDLKAPTKGDKISGAEFQKMMEERMKEFQKNGRGPGQRVIRLNE